VFTLHAQTRADVETHAAGLSEIGRRLDRLEKRRPAG
jgi:hypothetical protein